MQLIHCFGWSVSDYVSKELHREVQPPQNCPHCGRCGCLEALGYYSRYLVERGFVQAFLILVRRFRCVKEGLTVSVLPRFAQPYKLLSNKLIESHFLDRPDEWTERWRDLLRCYELSFRTWHTHLRWRIGNGLGREPPLQSHGQDAAMNYFRWLTDLCGGFSAATQALTQRFNIAPFGCYQCHGCYHTCCG